MPSEATIRDVEDRWRPLTEGELPVAQTLLFDSWEILRQQVPGIEARIQAGTLSANLVAVVQCAMVTRVLRNPDGLRQWSIDDASFTRDQALSSGLLYLADSEIAQLSPRGGSSMSAAYSLPLGG